VSFTRGLSVLIQVLDVSTSHGISPLMNAFFLFSELNPNAGRRLLEEISLLTHEVSQLNDHVPDCSTNPTKNPGKSCATFR
jgi:hypothetical protein